MCWVCGSLLVILNTEKATTYDSFANDLEKTENKACVVVNRGLFILHSNANEVCIVACLSPSMYHPVSQVSLPTRKPSSPHPSSCFCLSFSLLLPRFSWTTVRFLPVYALVVTRENWSIGFSKDMKRSFYVIPGFSYVPACDSLQSLTCIDGKNHEKGILRCQRLSTLRTGHGLKCCFLHRSSY